MPNIPEWSYFSYHWYFIPSKEKVHILDLLNLKISIVIKMDNSEPPYLLSSPSLCGNRNGKRAPSGNKTGFGKACLLVTYFAKPVL